MKRASLLLAAALIAGCSDHDKSNGTAAKKDQATVKDTGTSATAAAPYYEEIKRDNVIYVVASKASADKVKSGQKLPSHVAAFGFGPNGEKVMFESDKDSVDKRLMAEFQKRHPGK